MASKNQIIGHLDTRLLFENQTCPVFGSPISNVNKSPVQNRVQWMTTTAQGRRPQVFHNKYLNLKLIILHNMSFSILQVFAPRAQIGWQTLI